MSKNTMQLIDQSLYEILDGVASIVSLQSRFDDGSEVTCKIIENQGELAIPNQLVPVYAIVERGDETKYLIPSYPISGIKVPDGYPVDYLCSMKGLRSGIFCELNIKNK